MCASSTVPHGSGEEPRTDDIKQRGRGSQTRWQHILDSIKEYAVITLDGEGLIASWNRGAERLLGYSESEALGRSGGIFFTQEDREAGAPDREMGLARQNGRADNERWHVRKDDSRFWGSGVMLPVSDSGTDVYLKIFRDSTETRRAAARQAWLIDELNHRVKNTLAIVQSMAMQTLRASASPTEARDALESRLVSLAKAHDILTTGNWQGGDLHDLVAAELDAYVDGSRATPRFHIHGAALQLRPKALLALSMAMHELATNAVKYGALSNETGQVEVGWEIAGAPPRFHFHWRERGGPLVEPPQRRGFGSRLVEQGLSEDLACEVHLHFAPEGLECTIEAPLGEITDSES